MYMLLTTCIRERTINVHLALEGEEALDGSLFLWKFAPQTGTNPQESSASCTEELLLLQWTFLMCLKNGVVDHCPYPGALDTF